MLAGSLASVFLLALAAGTGDPRLPEWVQVPRPSPLSRAWSCANYSDSWYLDYGSGRLTAIFGPERRVEERIPFSISSAEDRRGDRHVARISSGWLVGFDAGEFGGGLWWYRTADAAGARIRPPADAPAHPKDYYKADNVQGFGRVDGELVVLMGLDHLGGRSGRAFKATVAGPDVVLAPWAVLDGSPRAWVADGKSLLVLTDSSVYRLSPSVTAAVVHRFANDLSGLYPTSLVRADDGQLYIGLRRYVIRLNPQGDRAYRELWWVPRDCLHFRLGHDCQCIPQG